MAKKRRGGPSNLGPSQRLPPTSDSPLDVLEDLPARQTGSAVLIGRPGSQVLARPLRPDRFPAKQVYVRLQKPKRNLLLQELRRLQFAVPSVVKVCVQRKRRREVLFASRKAGYSGSAKKRHWRRSVNSLYRC